jgi:S1-C subfamily serine protease
MDDEYGTSRARYTLVPLVAIAAATALAGAFLLALRAYSAERSDARALRAEVASVRKDVAALQARDARLTGRVRTAETRLKQKDAGVAPLAARVLKSVFTVRTPTGWFGAGFAAWNEAGYTYLVTANHVVAHTSFSFVTVERKGGSWSGEIVGRDPANDLAVVRVSGKPAGAAPLWDDPHGAPRPRTGDQLLLVGSPFGLEGTVTTGVVSRVTRRVIQTDAAANPGNSGGPALDRQGRVVGVLLAGGGENLNFAVPIERVCVKLRSC